MVSATQRTMSSGALPAGIAGGVVAGVVFGMLMQMMGMIPMVAMLVGSESVAVGWVVHLAISGIIGAGFGVLLDSRVSSTGSALGLGAAYGLVWWILGPLLIMPSWLGMPTFMFNQTTLLSLMGHLIYGVVLGIAFAQIRPRLGRS